MKELRSLTYIFILCSLFVVSCKDNSKNGNKGIDINDTTKALPYGATDTINGEKVSIDCAIIYNGLERLQSRVENIASPSMLMTVKACYQHEKDSLLVGIDQLSSEEVKAIQSICTDIEDTYHTRCKEYEIPACGVIDNLKRCIDNLNSVRNRTELICFMEPRRGMLMDLDKIHLCVESSSSKIEQVKSLAKQLSEQLAKKKKQYGLQ